MECVNCQGLTVKLTIVPSQGASSAHDVSLYLYVLIADALLSPAHFLSPCTGSTFHCSADLGSLVACWPQQLGWLWAGPNSSPLAL